MIPRRLQPLLEARLEEVPVVVLTGPRQAGKTTLALEVAQRREALYLDLESEADRAKLSAPELYLEAHLGRLVILDEVHRMPGLFPSSAASWTAPAGGACETAFTSSWAPSPPR